MNAVIGLVFIVFWLVLGASASMLFLSRHVERRPAAVLTAFALVSFFVGSLLPQGFVDRVRIVSSGPVSSDAAPTSSDSAAPAPAPDVQPTPIIDPRLGYRSVGGACEAVHVPPQPGGNGNIDVSWYVRGGSPSMLADDSLLRRSDSIRVIGWVSKPGGSTVASAACVAIDGHIVPSARVVYGGARPDVVAFFHQPNVLHCAFDASVSLRSLRAGRHVIEMVAVMSGGGASLAPGPRTFVVSGS